ncbi:hypothetical protein Egran_02824 [Elaphomyces granulatus]|uniref:Pectinesterase n=1 Tax=Elaphomyces granulatus TaxID=519963 RepID=A0A232LZ16_9EURO|nr:hypothetical protein Egran_02824 [Elaphomyces granulatus]
MKAMYTLLVILTAGVFTDPGTAIKIDQESCNAYMDFLKPAVESAFSMSTIAAKQLGNPTQMDSRPFTGISKAGQSAGSDIIIYCDRTRFQQNKEGYWVDIINNQAVKGTVIDECFDQGSTTGGRTRDIAYNWAAIRQLSNGYGNADSYAYMGLGTLLIMRDDISIEANGAITQSNA